MKTRVLALFSLVFISLSAFGQGPDLNLPDDPALAAEAKRRFAVAVDEVMIKRHEKAIGAINWLLINTPKLYDGLYINGYQAYEAMFEKTADETKKKVYLDSMFTVYKLKDEIYGLTDAEINNLAYRYYKYYKSDKSMYPEIKAAYDRVYQKPEKVINNNIVAYMDVYRRIFLTLKTVSEDEVLDVYTKIGFIIEQKLSAGGNQDRLQRYRQVVDQMLTSAVNVDCAFISEKLYPELKANPEDLNLAKKILQLGLSGKCSSEEFFVEAAIAINTKEPSATIANMIARTHAANKNFDEAEKYFNQAIGFEKNTDVVANMYFDMAKMFARGYLKSKSRLAALKAIELDNSLNSKAYSLIGSLYMGSFDDCKQSKSQVDDRAIFLLAYDTYQLAGDSNGMSAAKEQFPTVAQVFEQNLEEGSKISVGCWINQSTTIRTRPSN